MAREGLAALDLDHCRNPTSGEMEAWASDLVMRARPTRRSRHRVKVFASLASRPASRRSLPSAARIQRRAGRGLPPRYALHHRFRKTPRRYTAPVERHHCYRRGTTGREAAQENRQDRRRSAAVRDRPRRRHCRAVPPDHERRSIPSGDDPARRPPHRGGDISRRCRQFPALADAAGAGSATRRPLAQPATPTSRASWKPRKRNSARRTSKAIGRRRSTSSAGVSVGASSRANACPCHYSITSRQKPSGSTSIPVPLPCTSSQRPRLRSAMRGRSR